MGAQCAQDTAALHCLACTGPQCVQDNSPLLPPCQHTTPPSPRSGGRGPAPDAAPGAWWATSRTQTQPQTACREAGTQALHNESGDAAVQTCKLFTRGVTQGQVQGSSVTVCLPAGGVTLTCASPSNRAARPRKLCGLYKLGMGGSCRADHQSHRLATQWCALVTTTAHSACVAP